MKTSVHCHVTIEGKPVCERLSHVLDYQCGHVSLASARRAVRDLQTRYYKVRVVRGDCPAFPVNQRGKA